MEEKRYPRLICDLGLLEHNVREVIGRCHAAGIRVAGVVKGATALPPVVDCYVRGGSDQLASSRIEQLERMKKAHPELPAMLIRVPMMSELDRVACCCEYSLESDTAVLEALDTACGRAGRRHKVVLMADLGDLREGWWDQDELVAAALHVERDLPNLELAGVGTNLGCYGAIVPTVEKMEKLAGLACRVEEAVGHALEIVSGGASTSFLLVHQGRMPAKINHLRIGETILHGYDLQKLWGVTDMGYLSMDVFTLQAQVLECRVKPTYPVGTIFKDAFGNTPVYTDRGLRRRALVGVGRVDVGDQSKLLPKDPGVTVLGGSSDHTILDVEDCPRALKAGDVMEFALNYTPVLFLTDSTEVTVEYRGM